MIFRSMLIAALLLLRGHEAPTLSSLSPSTVIAGDGAFWLTINGSAFIAGSIARLDDVEQTTVFFSATKIAAWITASKIAKAGARQVTVVTPSGEASSPMPLKIVAPPPPPKLVSLSPAAVTAGGPALRVTVTGSDFAPTSLIEVDGATRATLDATATSLTTELSVEELKTPGTRRIRVVTPAPGGGTSTYRELRITARTSAPAVATREAPRPDSSSPLSRRVTSPH